MDQLIVSWLHYDCVLKYLETWKASVTIPSLVYIVKNTGGTNHSRPTPIYIELPSAQVNGRVRYSYIKWLRFTNLRVMTWQLYVDVHFLAYACNSLQLEIDVGPLLRILTYMCSIVLY